MLNRYAERRGFSTETLSSSESESGGFKEVVFAVKGDGAFSGSSGRAERTACSACRKPSHRGGSHLHPARWQ